MPKKDKLELYVELILFVLSYIQYYSLWLNGELASESATMLCLKCIDADGVKYYLKKTTSYT